MLLEVISLNKFSAALFFLEFISAHLSKYYSLV